MGNLFYLIIEELVFQQKVTIGCSKSHLRSQHYTKGGFVSVVTLCREYAHYTHYTQYKFSLKDLCSKC